MKYQVILGACIGVFIGFSCTEKYDMDLNNNIPRLVVEGLITDQPGPYYVRLTKSSSAFVPAPYFDPLSGNYVGETDSVNAFVIITDKTSGLKDTLIHSPDGYWYYYSPDDSIFSEEMLCGHDGYYQTTKLTGIAGHTYSIMIRWQNLEYHASSSMPEVPAIDSVRFNFTEGETGKEDYFIPLIYFREPQNQKNYYLFVTPLSYGRVWPYAVLDDEYLEPYVNGLDVFKGVSPDYWMTAYPTLDMPFSIEMHSLTREAYDFYYALLQQFKNDGGAYSPAPSSPPTNMDNGALGFFRASAVSRIDTVLRSDDNVIY
jgi:hypothetical protein